MPVSMYDASIPALKRGLEILSKLLDKGATHAGETGSDPLALAQSRLAPDMLTLAGQVQRASDTAKFAASRLTGETAPSFADDETTLDQLKERCARTIAFLDTIKPASFDGSETRMVTFGGETKWSLVGTAYVFAFALPNFYFHVTTAYDILRHEGVPVGKRDYLGPFA